MRREAPRSGGDQGGRAMLGLRALSLALVCTTPVSRVAVDIARFGFAPAPSANAAKARVMRKVIVDLWRLGFPPASSTQAKQGMRVAEDGQRVPFKTTPSSNYSEFAYESELACDSLLVIVCSRSLL